MSMNFKNKLITLVRVRTCLTTHAIKIVTDTIFIGLLVPDMVARYWTM